MKVPFSTLDVLHDELKDELKHVFENVVERGQFIHGDECLKFEKDFSSFCETRYAIGCGNGLDSITIALQAFGIGEGDEVILPAFSFIATALAIVRVGAKPVFVEVERETSLIDVNLIERAITSKTRAIVPVHLYGQPVDIDAISAIAKKYNLFVVFDAAQAHGAKYNGKSIGCYGDATCFSFYPGKNLGALGDAGGIVTNSDESKKMAMITNYGSIIRYHHDMLGVNSRLDELQAAFLSVKLRHIDKMIVERKKISKMYLNGIDNEKILLPIVKNGDHVWHIFAIHCEQRDAVQNYLKSKGIETNIHYPIPMHLQKSLSRYGYNEGDFPITEWLSNTELSLPLYYGMSEEQVEYVIDTINSMHLGL